MTVSEGEEPQLLTQGPEIDLKGPEKPGLDLLRKRLKMVSFRARRETTKENCPIAFRVLFCFNL